MAKMFPDTNCGKNSSEQRVYETLSKLSDEYYIFFNVPTLREGFNGEEDVIVLTPTGFLLNIQVKGGEKVGVENRKFYVIDGSGRRIDSDDPYDKSRDWVEEFVRRRLPLPCSGYGHCVWLPFISRINRKPLTALEDELKITLHNEDLLSPEAAIKRLEDYWLNHRAKKPCNLGQLRKVLTETLAPSREFSVCLSERINRAEGAIASATKAQYAILQTLSADSNILINGCAGSGKTFLAIEQALRLARQPQPKTSLIVCFNAALSEFITDIVGENGKGKIKVIHFHELCREIIRNSNKQVPTGEGQTYNELTLPNLAKESISQTTPKYDAVFVDEGQDFKENWWPILKGLLNENGHFFIFADNNQNVYRTKPSYPSEMREVLLSENCRNTQKIHKKILKFHNAPETIVCNTTEGEDVRFISIKNSNDYISKVTDIIKSLVPPVQLKQITILTPHGKEGGVWRDKLKIGTFSITWGRWAPGNIRCSSIRTFKGREGDVIILTELEDVMEGEETEMFYVGISRAKSLLYVLGPDDILNEIR